MVQKLGSQALTERARRDGVKHAVRIHNRWKKEGSPGGLNGLRSRFQQALSEDTAAEFSLKARSAPRPGQLVRLPPRQSRPSLKVPIEVRKAVMAIWNAFDFECRPGPVDGTVRATHFYPSRRVFPIFGSDNSDDLTDGSFFVSVKPTMGDSTNIHSYNISIYGGAYQTTDNTVSVEDSANWVSSLAGNDPRVDENMPLLLTQNLSMTISGANGTMTAALPLGTSQTFASNLGSTRRIRITSTGTASRMYLPPGSWNMNTRVIGTNLTSGVDAGDTLTGGSDVTVSYSSVAAATGFCGRALIDVTETAVDNGTNYVDWTVVNGGSATVTSGVVRFAPSFRPFPTDMGEVSAYQVGQLAVWFKFTAPPAYVGGTVYAALTGQDADKIWIKNDTPPPPGSFIDPENMGRLQSVHRGEIAKGAFVWYQHSDQVQRDFHIPSEQPTVDFPSIAIAGRAMVIDGVNATSTGFKGQIGELWVATNYYLDTSNAVWGTKNPSISEEQYQAAWVIAKRLPHAMENDSHFKMFKKVMGELGHDLKSFSDGALDFASRTMSLVKENAGLVAGMLF